MAKFKIAIVCNFPVWLVNKDFPANGGHYAVWLKALYDSFSENPPYEIHWITLSKDVAQVLRFSAGAQFFHILPRGKNTVGLYTGYAVERIRIASELKRIEPDLVHTWGTEDCYGLCGVDFRGKWMHSVQGLLKAYMERGPMPRFFRHHSIYEPGVLRACKYITTESPWAADRVRDTAANAEPMLFEYAVEECFFKQIREISDIPTCLYCGNNTEIKNLQCAVSAFSRPELAHVKLELAGVEPGSIPDLPSNIIPLGRISRDAVVQKLAQTWCLVHPSKADTGPTAAKEARVMGVPVILTTECGCKQYIEPGKSGYIISPNDVDALVKGVLDITADKYRAEEMGAYEQDKCRTALSTETMLNRLISLYNAVLKQ